jgi:hypothetical protein
VPAVRMCRPWKYIKDSIVVETSVDDHYDVLITFSFNLC